jgi:hypothetical protein
MDDRLTLWAHLVSRHACGIDTSATFDELVALHDHEHDGPGTIRNHPLEDRSVDDQALARVLAEVAESRRTSDPLPVELCGDCFAEVTASHSVVDGVSLAFADSRWVLVVEPGHRGDVLVEFSDAPWVDPGAGGTVDDFSDDVDVDVDEGEMFDASMRWIDTARAEMAPLGSLDVGASWRLVEAMRGAGYRPDLDGDADLWLYERCAQALS